MACWNLQVLCDEIRLGMARLSGFPRLLYGLLLAGCVCTLPSRLEAQLAAEFFEAKSAAQWAQLAQERGDASRGVNVFYQASLACVRCHVSKDPQATALGPNLGHAAEIAQAERLNDQQLVESILEPSKSIRKGYE